jgi:general secretion pathway protein I
MRSYGNLHTSSKRKRVGQVVTADPTHSLAALRPRPHSRGITLLEVLLSLAILAGSLAILGEVVRIGMRGATEAEEGTKAQLLCESVVSSVVAGELEPSPVGNIEFEEDPDWVYSIDLEPTADVDLMALRVTVARNLPEKKRPVSVTFVRWIPDPGLDFATKLQQQADQSRQDASSTSGESTDDSNDATMPQLPDIPGGGGGGR